MKGRSKPVVAVAKRTRLEHEHEHEEEDDIAYGYKGDYGTCLVCECSLDTWKTLGMKRCPPCERKRDHERRVKEEEKSKARFALLVPNDPEHHMAWVNLNKESAADALDALVTCSVYPKESVYSFHRSDKKKIYTAVMDDMALSKYDLKEGGENKRAKKIATKMGVFKDDETFIGPILFCGPNQGGPTTLFGREIDRFMKWAE